MSTQNQLTISDILDQIDVPSFAETYLPPPVKKERKNWLYDCSMCGAQKKVSFHPGINKNIPGPWKCNKCGESGNLFSFLTKLMGMSNKEAAKLLKRAAGIPEEKSQNQKQGQKRGRGSKSTKGNNDNKEDEKGPSMVVPPSSQAIYQRFVELTHLDKKHRQEIKDKRGFSDATIDFLKLRSGGDYVAKIIEQLKSEFSEDQLVVSGVVVKENNTLIPYDQLIQDRILIPYLNEQGNAYHIRPHKLGFSGIAPHPFCRYFLRDKPETVVLTEGEFKAVALAMEWNIDGMSVPGISSFVGKHFERLRDLLKEFGVKKVVVIFDNEEKGDPSLPNFKERVEDRFDTPFWAYILAYKLSKEGFQTGIADLPDEWRENGKIDFDGALAQGHTREEIERVIRGAVPPNEYLESQKEEAQQIIRRKVANFFKKFAIRRRFNKYVATRFKGKETYEEEISNFVINIKNNYYTVDGVIRNVELVNEFAEKSDQFSLEPGDMAGGDSFKKFCFSKGNYIFKGNSQDLINIWELEFSRDTGSVIHVPEKIGRVRPNVWLFGNLAIKDGQVYRPGDDGVIWIDGEGFKPQSLHLGPRDEPIEDAIPSLYEGDIDIAGIADRMKHCIGGYEAYIGIGWVVMNIFSRDIFKKYKCLPFLFPHGRRESGKSSFLRWIIRFFGIESDGISLPETSQNYIMRALGYFSSLGVWFDEYRNENNVTKKDGYLRSAYNRQLSGKGIKNTFGARGYDVSGCIAITGEEVPKDSGLFTRSCFIQLSSNKRNRKYYDDLNVECEKFSGFVYHLILNYDKYRDEILKSIKSLKANLVQLKITDRTAENWAILAGCFEAVVKKDIKFIKWVVKSCKELKLQGEDDHALTMFLDNINYMVSTGEINVHKFIEYRPGENKIFIYFKGIYEAWSQHYRKTTGKEPFNRNTISDYIRDEPYFIVYKQAKINGVNRHCYVLDVSHAPDSIREIADVIMTNQSER